MRASVGWQFGATFVLIVGLNLWAVDGTLRYVGSGLIGLAVWCIGESAQARIHEAERTAAKRLARALRGGSR